MAKKKTEEEVKTPEVETLKVEETVVETKVEEPVVEEVKEVKAEAKERKRWHFTISDADGFAHIKIVDQHGKKAPKGLEVADGIIQASDGSHFVFAGSKREAAARLAADGFTEL